jgi:hypothetical protein
MTDSTIHSTSSSFSGYEPMAAGAIAVAAIAAGGVPALVAVAALAVIAFIGIVIKNYLNSAALAREEARAAANTAAQENERAAAQSAEFNQESMRLYENLYRALKPQLFAATSGRGGYELAEPIARARQAIKQHEANQPAGVVEEARVGVKRKDCEMAVAVIELERSDRDKRNFW